MKKGPCSPWFQACRRRALRLCAHFDEFVATGHGRDAIGIDLDERNAHLAAERIGMFLTVTDTRTGAA